jgi:hypothetical protein
MSTSRSAAITRNCEAAVETLPKMRWAGWGNVKYLLPFGFKGKRTHPRPLGSLFLEIFFGGK